MKGYPLKKSFGSIKRQSLLDYQLFNGLRCLALPGSFFLKAQRIVPSFQKTQRVERVSPKGLKGFAQRANPFQKPLGLLDPKAWVLPFPKPFGVFGCIALGNRQLCCLLKPKKQGFFGKKFLLERKG